MPDVSVVITSGEPAGIGPDIVASIEPARFDARLVVIGDRQMLTARAAGLGSRINFVDYGDNDATADCIEVIDQPLAQPARAGQLDSANAEYVLQLLQKACKACLDGEFDAMVTAPVQKEIINRAGIAFSGHTEFLAEICRVPKPVMLLIADRLRVALVTTHLPLREVADAITGQAISDVVEILDRDLRSRFGLPDPMIKVCGLNPHAGENGYLGREEIDIIKPALDRLKASGINLAGPFPADTLFTTSMLQDADAVVAMYHDQGLPVLKHVGFHNAVNTTLGLPIIRTSVDHGTALDLAGSPAARPDSLFAAIDSAILQAQNLKLHASRA
ncbi:MAG: 4-hydroxythreonine-4-phosphate dehydrogenase PdxA [Gammaproteobacteria bacterium]|nr:MAG: 4-hydroxythreonine-4-phosphate dehydrogenase PdxA [Gammaproteobacteria bacterium]